MNTINTNEYPIYVGNDGLTKLNTYLEEVSFSRVFILVDENTRALCLPLLLADLPQLNSAELIEIVSGEENKTLSTCDFLWQKMTQKAADRNALWINLGGGVISDMGGFVAKTYKRGIRFINIPTTLLSQVDASIGGKLAVDFNGFKNHIGLFDFPEMIFVQDRFLKTLSARELRSGYAEIIKHALIASKDYWNKIKNNSFSDISLWNEFIEDSIWIKKEIVEADPYEKGVRKTLNFGHTIGHAIETYFMNSNRLLHGEAIAAGMIMEGYLSVKYANLNQEDLKEYETYILSNYGKVALDGMDINILKGHMLQDKKNVNQQLSFTLLNEIGKASFDTFLDFEAIESAIDYYKSL